MLSVGEFCHSTMLWFLASLVVLFFYLPFYFKFLSFLKINVKYLINSNFMMSYYRLGMFTVVMFTLHVTSDDQRITVLLERTP